MSGIFRFGTTAAEDTLPRVPTRLPSKSGYGAWRFKQAGRIAFARSVTGNAVFPGNRSKSNCQTISKLTIFKGDASACHNASGGTAMTIFEKLRLLSEYAPLLSFAQDIMRETDPHRKAVLAADVAEWLATKTDAEWDDELISLIADIIKCDEGEALLRWFVEQTKGTND